MEKNIQNRIENPANQLRNNINSMCLYLSDMHKCSMKCRTCPLVKTLQFIKEV